MAGTLPPESPESPLNPYTVPNALAGPGGDGSAADSSPWAIRRAHLRHERMVMSLGRLAYAASAACLIVALTSGATWVANTNTPPTRLATICVASLALARVWFSLGRGLRRLEWWARWTSLTVASLIVFIGCVAVASVLVRVQRPEQLWIPAIHLLLWVVLPGATVHLLASRKGRTLFTAQYRAVIEQTEGPGGGTAAGV
jgi:hypothetical protein